MEKEAHTDLVGGELLKSLTNGDEVLERFGHLKTVDVEMACVQEVIHSLSIYDEWNDIDIVVITFHSFTHSPTCTPCKLHSEPSRSDDEGSADPHHPSGHQCSHH